MRTFVVILILFMVVALPAAAQDKAGFDVDLSGVDLFWRVTEILARDEAPDSALWEAMFSSPGYAPLRGDEKKIRSFIEMVFRPSNATLLQKTLADANYWRRRDLEHLIAVRGARTELQAYQKRINIDDAIRQGTHEARAYLPPGTLTGTPPAIRFVIFSPDARAMGGQIIFDLAYTRNLGLPQLAKMMGHEFHHHFIGKNAEFALPESKSPHYGLARAIRQLQVEGVADLIDKFAVDSARANDPDWQRQWRVPFNSTRERLARLDSMLVELDRDSTKAVAYGKIALDELFPMGGHPNGNAMARLILKHIGRDAIIASLGNPFEFFRLYDQAARQSGTGHVFSATATAYLNDLEQQFVRGKD